MEQLLEPQQRRRPTTRAQSRKRTMEEIKNFVYESIEKEVECPVCFESCIEMGMTVAPCGHFLCKICARNITFCPLCRHKFTFNQCFPVYL